MGIDGGLCFTLIWGAWGGALTAVSVDGPLRPGQHAHVEVALPEGVSDTLEVEGVLEWARSSSEVEGVVRLKLTPDPAEGRVSISNEGDGERLAASLPVSLPDPNPLRVSVSPVREGRARIEVSGEGLTAHDELRVVLGEGVVMGRHPGPSWVFDVEIDGAPYPRSVPFAVEWAGSGHPPVYGGIQVWAQPTLPLEVEPGATVSLEVGGRQYGPWQASDTGLVKARIEQGPRDRYALAVFSDPLGNTVRSRVPLASRTQPWLLGVVQEAPPGASHGGALVLRVQEGSGQRIKDEPRCISDGREVPSGGQLSDGSWWVPLKKGKEAARVVCGAAGIETVFEAPGARRYPASLDLQLWPPTLVAAAPRAHADLRLLDQEGMPLDLAGVFSMEASHGDWVLEPERSGKARARWQGGGGEVPQVVEMTADWQAETGHGKPGGLEVSWSGSPTTEVQVAVMDVRGRPLANAPVQVWVGEGLVTTDRTSASGVVGVSLGGTQPLTRIVRVVTGNHERQLLMTPASRRAPALALGKVEVSREVGVRGGPMRSIQLAVQPPVLRAGPGSRAVIEVRLEDEQGRWVDGEDVTIHASEGTVGPIRRAPSGTWVAMWEPSGEGGERRAEIVAEAGGQRSATLVQVQPEPVQLAVGPWLGFRVASGGLISPSAEINVDVRTKWMDESVLVRAGAGAWLLASDLEMDGEAVALRGYVSPLMLAVLLRRDLRNLAVWGGGGAVAGFYGASLKIGGEVEARSLELGGGPMMVVGVGWTKAQGELALEFRGSWFQVDADALGFAGNVGGISPGVSYRLVY